MMKMGLVLLCVGLVCCKNKKTAVNQEGLSFDEFANQFRSVPVPYQVSDTGLMRNTDTSVIRDPEFPALIPDSLRSAFFGKGTRVRYIAMAKMSGPQKTHFYIVKGIGGNKRIALLLAFNKDQFGGVFPLLVPDNNPATTQYSAIDGSFSIQRNVTLRQPDNSYADGRDVFDYNPSKKAFSLTLTDPVNNTMDIINPIDSFARKHKFSADYYKDKKNFISIRDGHHPNELLAFIHIEKKEGGCSGELKATLFLTSATTATYREGGDPCVMSFRFSPNSLTIKEDHGCGSHRGVDCSFDGQYERKKEVKPKVSIKKRTHK